ncbi:hypothetical protein [Flavobacterium humidisoli]|uniref:Uncharacterized protein n=1 Tax=Flavobacterium humidisoli TaxID=2937442 RepID=A0ABY4M1Y4_9FLAO|nr:hypothetical protein [Flavobacterium humidisoli]UPZ17861.1 hypothetical protein M0M44_11040 [Flavobacterium humidisoli]
MYNQSGDYKNSNVFQNVPSGIHTIYTKDLNGCLVTKEAAVLGIPHLLLIGTYRTTDRI